LCFREATAPLGSSCCVEEDACIQVKAKKKELSVRRVKQEIVDLDEAKAVVVSAVLTTL
jgi:hypothetical protein